MPKYAQFDPSAASPAPVLAWIDTDAFPAALPSAASLITLTADQWAAHWSGLWVVSAGALVPYAPPAPVLTAAQQAWAAIAGGLTITSPTLGVAAVAFGCDAATTGHLNDEVTAIVLTGAFLDGTASITWPTLTAMPNGTFFVALTVAQFKTLALTIGAFVGAATKVVLGIPGAAVPTPAITIP